MISKMLQILGLQPRISKVSRSLEQFFLTVGQNNFGNKIPFLNMRFHNVLLPMILFFRRLLRFGHHNVQICELQISDFSLFWGTPFITKCQESFWQMTILSITYQTSRSFWLNLKDKRQISSFHSELCNKHLRTG